MILEHGSMCTQRIISQYIFPMIHEIVWSLFLGVKKSYFMYMKNRFCLIAVWSLFNCSSEKCIHHVIGVFFYIGLNNDFWCLTILINFTWNTFNLQEKKTFSKYTHWKNNAKEKFEFEVLHHSKLKILNQQKTLHNRTQIIFIRVLWKK